MRTASHVRAALVGCLLAQLAPPASSRADVPTWQRSDASPAYLAMQRAPFWEPRDGAGEQLAYTLRVALSSQRLEDVRGAAAQLATIAEPSPTVRQKLGEAYFRTGQFAACHKTLATLSHAAPGTQAPREAESSLLLHAHCLARDGQPEPALELLQRAMRRGDETANGWFLIGECLALLGRWQPAHEAFARALQLQRSGSAAWAVAVFAELAAGQVEGEKAALIALSLDSRLTAWRRAYLGAATTAVPTIAPAYEYLVQALMFRTIERHAEALAMARLAGAALQASSPPAAVARDVGKRLAAISAFVAARAERGDVRATGLTQAEAEARVRPRLPALRKCVAAMPLVVYEVKLTRSGASARPINNDGATPAQLGAGTDCLAAAAKEISLPTGAAAPTAPLGAQPVRVTTSRAGAILPGGIRPVEIVFKVISL